MLGAIIGDMAGAQFENTPDPFSDDTVLTVATAAALLVAHKENRKPEVEDFAWQYRIWASRYSDHGFGPRFMSWVKDPKNGPCDSYANGAAMRVSPCADCAKTLEEAINLAGTSAICSHNNPPALLGAKAIAAASFMARQKASKDQILDFIDKNFYSRSVINFANRDVVTSKAEITIPLALNAFFTGNSFDDVISLAIENATDKDTVANMAGAIAESFFGISEEKAKQAVAKLTPPFAAVVNEFYSTFFC